MDPVLNLLRMAWFARRRPSRLFAYAALGAFAAAAIFGGIEYLWGWPEALTVNRVPSRIQPLPM